jgi:hypothetical protein
VASARNILSLSPVGPNFFHCKIRKRKRCRVQLGEAKGKLLAMFLWNQTDQDFNSLI